MTNYALSLHFGLNKNYFSVMRCNNIHKYDFIFSFDESKIKSINKFIRYIKNILIKMECILDFYSNKQWLYGKKLGENKISLMNAKKQVYQEDCLSVYRIRFSILDYLSISFLLIQRYEKIIALFSKKLFLKKLLLFTYRSK